MGWTRAFATLLILLGVAFVLISGVCNGVISRSPGTLAHSTETPRLPATPGGQSYLFGIWGTASNDSGSWPCGTSFSFPVYLRNATSFAGVQGVNVSVQDSMDDSISASNGSETDQNGQVWFEFLTQTQVASADDTISATAVYHGTVLRATYNLTISIQAFNYTVFVEALPQATGSSVQSGTNVPLTLDVDWHQYPIHDALVVVSTSDGVTLATFLYEPEKAPWYVTAPAVSSPTTLQLFATASELGVVLGESNTTLRVLPTPLQPGNLQSYIATSWLLIVPVVTGILVLITQIIVGWSTPRPLVYTARARRLSSKSKGTLAVAVWNRGRTAIAPEDILPSSGLSIQLPSNSRASIVDDTSNGGRVTNFQLVAREGQSHTVLRFGLWPPRTGVLLCVTTNENPETVSISGAIRHGGEVLRSDQTLSSWFLRIVWLFPLIGYPVMSLIILAVLFPITYPGTITADVEVLALLGGPILAFWLSGKTFHLGPAMPKLLRRKFDQYVAADGVERAA